MSPTVEHGAALDSVLVHHHRSATGFTNHPALSDSRERLGGAREPAARSYTLDEPYVSCEVSRKK